jgi:hypothetical protein
MALCLHADILTESKHIRMFHEKLVYIQFSICLSTTDTKKDGISTNYSVFTNPCQGINKFTCWQNLRQHQMYHHGAQWSCT